MRKIFWVVLLLVAVVIGVGVYRDWFRFASTSGESQHNVSITVDKDKIQSDVNQAKEKIETMTGKETGQ